MYIYLLADIIMMINKIIKRHLHLVDAFLMGRNAE